MSIPIETTNSGDQIKIKPTPWAKIESPILPCSLEEVMSEQLAQDLTQKEAESSLGQLNLKDEAENATNLKDPNATVVDAHVDNDFLLAQLLQHEFDKEFDELLKSSERIKNRDSRVQISFDKFKSVHPINVKDEKEINESTKVDLPSESESEDELEKLTFKRGVHGKGENMISKHDILLNNRHNASKVMKFPPEFETGDTHGIDMRIPNKVFNELKVHSLHEEKRYNRLHDKQDKATQEMSLDPKTRLILFKLVNSDILESIGGIISTGKEATIFYAPGGKSQEMLVPKECVAKVFKTTLNEFKTREKYISEDYRFKDRYKHLNPQKIVKLWAEKEMHNLMKMRKFGIPCPEVVLLKRHVLIMSFIGQDSVPAPKLKEAKLDQSQLKSCYEQCVHLMKDIYTRCNLVHADFNQFNLLWHENRVWVIDVSQSVEPNHPLGLEFLLRDCQNVNKFFTSRNVENVRTAEEIFMEVTGMNFKGESELFLSNIQRFVKEKQNELSATVDEKAYNFDFHFERSVRAKEKKEKGEEVSDEEKSSSDDSDSTNQ